MYANKKRFLQNRILHGWETSSKDISKTVVAVFVNLAIFEILFEK